MNETAHPTMVERKPWLKPEVERIAAGDAENGINQAPEGLATS